MAEEKFDRASLDKMARFERKFFDSDEVCTYIGSGSIGGKAQGLVFIKDSLLAHFNHALSGDYGKYPDIYGNRHRYVRRVYATE
jgi:hypothetical protein